MSSQRPAVSAAGARITHATSVTPSPDGISTRSGARPRPGGAGVSMREESGAYSSRLSETRSRSRKARYASASVARSSTIIRRAPRRPASGRVVAGAVRGRLDQADGGSEARPVHVLEVAQRLQNPRGGEVVDDPQGPAAEGGEADAEEGAHVAVARAPDGTLVERHGGLVEHGVDQAPLHDTGIGVLDRPDTEQCIDGVVYAGLVAVVIAVEPAPVLPAEPAVAQEPCQGLGWLEPVAEGRVHHAAGLLGHVEPDLVEQ